MQFSAGEAGVPEFRKSLEPLRQLLAEYPYLGGKDGPSYADHFVAAMFMVGLSSLILRPFYILVISPLLSESSQPGHNGCLEKGLACEHA